MVHFKLRKDKGEEQWLGLRFDMRQAQREKEIKDKNADPGMNCAPVPPPLGRDEESGERVPGSESDCRGNGMWHVHCTRQLTSETLSLAENSLMNLMKDMYEDGDSSTRQMMAKAWHSAKVKSHKENPKEPVPPDMPF